MVWKYAYKTDNEKVGRVHQKDVKQSEKKCYLVCRQIIGMPVQRALEFLDNVLDHKEIVPVTKYHGGASHQHQAHRWGFSSGKWPTNATKTVRSLLMDAIGNCKAQHEAAKNPIQTQDLEVRFAHVSMAAPTHRRRYRAHGRIGKIDSQPCHIQVIVGVKPNKDDEKAIK